uniref:Uncharacterized protein n=1 Tax=Salvator merianae TaxID=96440 RepID=A0A8D0BIH9_SALMN
RCEESEEVMKVGLLQNQVMDFRKSLLIGCYSPNFFKKKNPKTWLFGAATGDKCLAEDKITFVDFLTVEELAHFKVLGKAAAFSKKVPEWGNKSRTEEGQKVPSSCLMAVMGGIPYQAETVF